MPKPGGTPLISPPCGVPPVHQLQALLTKKPSQLLCFNVASFAATQLVICRHDPISMDRESISHYLPGEPGKDGPFGVLEEDFALIPRLKGTLRIG